MNWLSNPIALVAWGIISIGVSLIAYSWAEKVPEYAAKHYLKSESLAFTLVLMWGIYIIVLSLS